MYFNAITATGKHILTAGIDLKLCQSLKRVGRLMSPATTATGKLFYIALPDIQLCQSLKRVYSLISPAITATMKHISHRLLRRKL